MSEKPAIARSPLWPQTRAAWLIAHPRCVACGSTAQVEVHHRRPVHLFPDLELDQRNFVTLCEGPNRCHLREGHLGDFHIYNPLWLGTFTDTNPSAESLTPPASSP